MPVAQLNKPGCHPISTSQAQNYRDLLMQVNIGPVDRRDNLSAFSNVISAREAANITRILGTVVCESPGFKSEADGFVVEDGRQIETNVHVFTDENFNLLDPLPKCTFSTKANPSRTFNLILTEGYRKFGTTRPNSDRANDFAFVRLDDVVDNIEPLKFGPPPMPGETIYMISTRSDYAIKPLDPDQLVGRACVNIHSYSATKNANSSFLNTCDNVKGDSSALYFANRGGVLQAVGLHQSGGRATANGLAFNITTKDKDKLSYGMGLGFDDRMLNMSAELVKRSSEQANARSERKTKPVKPDRS
jgi:hypothetical protein